MATIHSRLADLILALICAFLCTQIVAVHAAPQCPPNCDIQPGKGIRADFLLGGNLDETLKRFSGKGATELHESDAGSDFGTIDTGHGVRLHYDRTLDTIKQIVITTPDLFTDRGINTYSRYDDVLLEYGAKFDSFNLKEDGYYLRYPQKGIGFDIAKETGVVRAIVVFNPQSE